MYPTFIFQNLAMRTISVFCLLATSLLLFACRSLTYLESPNSLRNIDGTLYLIDGKTVDGKLVIQTDNLLGSPVKVYSEGEKKPMQFSLSNIRGYRMRNEVYELKEIREGLSLGRQQYFMRRLTPEDGRMHLYEFMQRHRENKTTTRYVPEYYLQLPGEDTALVYSTTGSRLVPNFDEKMSKLIGDCTSLAQKIRHKKDGYFYAQVSLLKEKRVDVLLRIIREYNECN
jgi:hypothetical protein